MLFKRLAQITLERGGMRIEWICLKDNYSSIKFYKSLGGKELDIATTFRLENEMLETLAKDRCLGVLGHCTLPLPQSVRL